MPISLDRVHSAGQPSSECARWPRASPTVRPPFTIAPCRSCRRYPPSRAPGAPVCASRARPCSCVRLRRRCTSR
ncbi:hypothetical protein ADK34_25610 [Streptomyces viridochromogenes]|uniref:Uncharacterized protein n=1 Tax=Streptomyces viridochromogenes TaxID=1938 RepID=A0A0L8JVZ0_STRVR|nr:hypothetical protein ADK34_25610 [Streptomyces viridochromogenes]